MNLQIIKRNKYYFLVLLTILFFTGCWDFLTVDQPDLANPNSYFDVPITISLTAEPDSGRGYFGILLPVGWTARDSIVYSGVHNGIFIYSSSQSDSMENFDPAPSGYYWWICVGDSVDSLKEGTISFIPKIYTDNQIGTFFIDYIIADRFEWGYYGSEYVVHSGRHPVSINAPMTATVTNTNDNGPGSLRQALSDVSSSGEILFSLSYPDTIQLDSQLVIDRNVTITGPASGDLNIFGTDSSRVFWVNENLKKVKLYNLKISHGNDYYGGGISCVSSNLNLNNIIISNNSAGSGGGIYFYSEWPGPKTDFHPGRVTNFMHKDVKEHYCLSQLNKSIANYNKKELTLNKVTFFNNRANYGGGAIDCSDIELCLINVIMSDNSNFDVGGGILGADSNAIIVNSIIWNNLPDNFYNSYPKIFYSDVMGGWPGIGNIDTDPMFVDTANGDYRLQAGSPCIDAGTAFFEFGGDTLINLNPWQYNGTAPDMGAYEFGPPVGIEDESISPITYTLNQNYPNPFNPTTTIEFSIPKTELVTLKIYNLLGQEIMELVAKRLTPGNYKYTWDASEFASGVYYYKIIAGGFIQIHKMILLQ